MNIQKPIPSDKTPIIIDGKTVRLSDVIGSSRITSPRIYPEALRSPAADTPRTFNLPSAVRSPGTGGNISKIARSSPVAKSISEVVSPGRTTIDVPPLPDRQKQLPSPIQQLPSPLPSARPRERSPLPSARPRERSPLPSARPLHTTRSPQRQEVPLPPPEIPSYLKAVLEHKNRGPYVPDAGARVKVGADDSFIVVDYDGLSPRQKMEKAVYLRQQWENLYRKAPKVVIPPPATAEGLDLYELHYTVREQYIQAMVNDKKAKYRMILIGVWMGIEILLIKAFNVNAKGYTLRNLRCMQTMDEAFDTFCTPSENQTSMFGDNPIMSILFMSGIQLLMAIGINFVEKKYGPTASTALDAGLTTFFSGDVSSMEATLLRVVGSMVT